MELSTVMSKDSSEKIFRKFIWEKTYWGKKSWSMEMWARTVSADHGICISLPLTSILVRMNEWTMIIKNQRKIT